MSRAAYCALILGAGVAVAHFGYRDSGIIVIALSVYMTTRSWFRSMRSNPF